MSGFDTSDFIRKLNEEVKRGDKTDDDGSFGFKLLGFILGIFFSLMIIIPVSIYAVWAYGIVGAQLWEWFVVPVFGVDPITRMQAYGLGLFASLYVWTHVVWKGEDTRKVTDRITEIFGVIFRPWLFLLLGWIIVKYVM